MIVGIEDIARVHEIRFRGLDQNHYLIVPANSANELVVLSLLVHNADATRVLMTVDEEAVELRGFGTNEVYKPLNPLLLSNVKVVEESHPSENRYSCIPEEYPHSCAIAGPIELPQGHQITGWMVFEVPKGAKLREMRWDAGDTVFIRS